jgi:hypothetical protein
MTSSNPRKDDFSLTASARSGSWIFGGRANFNRSASPKLNAQFQNELLENMKLCGRKEPFTGV